MHVYGSFSIVLIPIFIVGVDPARGGHAGPAPPPRALEGRLPRALEGPIAKALDGPLPRALEGLFPRVLDGPLPWTLGPWRGSFPGP